jgi:hypothetical protein
MPSGERKLLTGKYTVVCTMAYTEGAQFGSRKQLTRRTVAAQLLLRHSFCCGTVFVAAQFLLRHSFCCGTVLVMTALCLITILFGYR